MNYNTRSSRNLEYTLALIFIIASFVFQTGMYSYFLEDFTDQGPFLKLGYYGFWMTCGAASALSVLQNPRLIIRVASFWAVLIGVAALTLLHPPMTNASRSLVVATYAMATVSTVLVASRNTSLMQLSAALAMIASLSLIFEMYITVGPSSVPGRSAGLWVNPNVAAAALVLSGTACAPFVPAQWRGAYAVIIFSGVLATVSRSALLVLVGATVVNEVAQWLRGKRYPKSVDTAQIARIAVTALACATVFCIAVASNENVSSSVSRSAATSLSSIDVLEQSRGNFADGEAATQIANHLGKVDSGAARLVLMLNSVQQVTLWGKGADQAHDLAPHNWYLFLAVAFGLPGVICAIAFAAVIIWTSRSNLIFGLSAVGILGFTHDLTSLVIALPIAVGYAGCLILSDRIENPRT